MPTVVLKKTIGRVGCVEEEEEEDIRTTCLLLSSLLPILVVVSPILTLFWAAVSHNSIVFAFSLSWERPEDKKCGEGMRMGGKPNSNNNRVVVVATSHYHHHQT